MTGFLPASCRTSPARAQRGGTAWTRACRQRIERGLEQLIASLVALPMTAFRATGWRGVPVLLLLAAAASHADQLHAPAAYPDAVQRASAPSVHADAGSDRRGAPPGLAANGDHAATHDPGTPGTIAVVYPDLGEPYRSIFAQIVEGIEDKATLAVDTYPVGADSASDGLDAQLRRDRSRIVIALGRQGLKAATALNPALPVIVGGVLAVPAMENRDLLSISLTPDPALLFARLKSLLPGVRRVHVVYSPSRNDWLIKLAHEAAKAQGLDLVTYEANDLGTAVRDYQAAFAASDSHRDAIWLPQDATTVDESTILPLVLRESWNRSVPVFSSSFLHVKKGALFALYPNNLELGKTLAVTAQRVLSGELHRRGLQPLRQVQTAINLRTASHIGLAIDYQQQRSFDFIFPEP